METNKYKHGFKVPEGYFQDFENNLFVKIKENELPESYGFKVPDRYFDSLEDTIMHRVEASAREPKVFTLLKSKTIYYAAAVAACIILVFSLSNQKTSLNKSFENVQFSTIESYINDGSIEMDSYDVTALLNDDDISSLNFDSNFYSEENLENYLLENLDITTLSTE
jgi:hypothetical protein